MRRRVVITGMGVITPLGHSVRETFGNMLEGKSGVDRISNFDARTFPTTFAAQVKDFDLSRYVLRPERYAKCGVNTRFGLAAARQALDDAGLGDGAAARVRCGIYLGCGEGSDDFQALNVAVGQASDERGFRTDPIRFVPAAARTYDGSREAEMEMHTTTGHIANEFDLPGPNFTCLTACAASAQAIGEAAELIRYGDAEVMLSGGAHSMIHPFGVTGFNRLTALSTRNDCPQKASRPFDLTRDGFVLGEGAGMVVLEEYEHAKRRKATIYAEVTGYGTTGDAYAMTDPHPDGQGAVACMAMALDDAHVPRDAIGYVNAHG